ncbi:iron-containing alcohol dehydrogenase [Ningiella sp. W23]|uniref:iron-containing alcohol dehydrogenase n=1 Tax=Ningiella sp. W23 TaxID=3023715 RepID=UPI00375708CB
MGPFEFASAKKIVNQINGMSDIAKHCASLGIKRPCVITDPGILASGLLEPIESTLLSATESSSTCTKSNNGIAAVAVFSDVQADPSEKVIEQALLCALSHHADGIIGFGGGSAMDCAKVVSVLASDKAEQSNIELASCYGIEQIHCERLPLICIPTTAGTGSEVTPIAVITTGETTKAGIVSSKLIPDIALLDAQLTLSLPAHVTAATGIDAMVHAIEAYTSIHKKNMYSDMLARQALSLLSQNIETATFDGQNILARQNMLLGACLAGQAFANAPVAAVHALAYPLGGHFHIPHGLSNALVLPHVLKFNHDSAYKQYAQLAPFVVNDLSPQQNAQDSSHALIEYAESLTQRLNLPTKLRDLNIARKDLPLLADDAMLQTRLLTNNPKTVKRSDALAIYEAAF